MIESVKVLDVVISQGKDVQYHYLVVNILTTLKNPLQNLSGFFSLLISSWFFGIISV
jgi:hypothetical protein